MVDVPSASSAAEKFSRRGSQATQDYESGVSGTSDQEQQQAAAEAEDRWSQAVQEAASDGRYGRGVNNPDASWQQRSLEIGSQRFAGGIQAAQSKYENAVGPFFDALEALTLSPRGPRGSQQNYQRSQEVGQRLNELREQR